MIIYIKFKKKIVIIISVIKYVYKDDVMFIIWFIYKIIH